MQTRTNTEIEVLYRISQAITHQHNVSALLAEVLDIIETEMGMSRGTLTLRQPGTDIFVIEASRGLTEEEKKRGQYQVGEGITGKVAKTGKPLIVPDISREPEFLNLTGTRRNARVAFLCVPIIHRRDVIGTISIDRPRASEKDLKKDQYFLQLVANVLAEAVAGIREQIEERQNLLAENIRLKQELDERYRPGNIVGNCSSMRAVFRQIAQVADSTATVLIRGETGTGKELVAQAIHHASSRRPNPFISVNCAALPENLIESELFGHEKGSFTGAAQQRKGRFELANGGTLFLDEVGDISPAVQVRLLRVIQERTFERVGGHQTMSVNVRLIAATSKNIEEAIKREKFREDLYYRLNVFPIHLPPLRERRADIILLADHFLQKYNALHHKTVKRISTPAINMMMMYHWPGNVRELENCIERAVLSTSDEVIHGYILPPSLQTSEATHTSILPDDGASLKTMVASYERELIVDALKKFRGNVTAVARHLRTTKRIVHYKIRRLSVEPRHYK
ncbi:MAG: sigma 54-interacting transcriptional regulator [Lentisphaerae bacterium]|nr:sigma 54-interacting transcriptional regulator [Lentisphaerota bacterium]